MFLWFAACGVLVVLVVFDSRGVDYRFVAAGSVLPVAENLSGAPWLLHTLAGSLALFAAVMAATSGRGRRLARRRWIGLPIGTLVFLVASGAFTSTELFWWPLAGGTGVGNGISPELDRPVGVIVALEVAGVVVLCWIWRRCGLSNTARRATLLRTGQMRRLSKTGGSSAQGGAGR